MKLMKSPKENFTKKETESKHRLMSNRGYFFVQIKSFQLKSHH